MILKTEKILKKFTDYNEHLNVAFYVYIFDKAADVMLDMFKMGELSAKKEKKTTFVAEMHTAYFQEVKLGDFVETHLTYINHDKKRIHYRLSMFHKEKKHLIAKNEVISLFVNLKNRRVIEFDPDRAEAMKKYIETNLSNFDSGELIFSEKLN